MIPRLLRRFSRDFGLVGSRRVGLAPRRAARQARGPRLCRLEPLEERTVLSLSLAGTEVPTDESMPTSPRIAFVDDGPMKTAVVEFSFAGMPDLTDLGAGYAVSLEGEESWVVEGDPVVPVRESTLLLPQGTQICSVAVDYLDPGLVVATGIQLAAAPMPGTSDEPGDWTVVTEAFPARQPVAYSNYTLAGYRLGSLRVFPVQYEAGTGTVTYHSEIAVTLTTAPADDTGALPTRDSEADRARVTALVDNPEMLESYQTTTYASATPGDDDAPMPLTSYEYVIITSSALESSFQSLVDQKISRGLTAGIVTTEYIYDNYSLTEDHTNDPQGASGVKADKIRSFIRDSYLNRGTTWVLLGGDVDVVPQRGVYVESGSWVEYNMPSDMYFACLDGPWNSDGDNRWGEGPEPGGPPGDGAGGGEIDLMPEVYIGRAPVSNTTEATNFVNKTIQYETTAHPNPTKAIFLGEKLSDTVYGADSCIEIRNDCLPASWLDDLVERYDKVATWTGAQFTADLNASPHIVTHLGHGATTSNARLNNSTVEGLTNTDPYFMYSQACDSGAFDANDSIAEKHVVSAHGAFGVVMNAREGWYASFPSYSHYYAKEFWDAIFNKGKLHLGEANHDSKIDNIASVGWTGTYR